MGKHCPTVILALALVVHACSGSPRSLREGEHVGFTTIASGVHIVQDWDFDRMEPELHLFNNFSEIEAYLAGKNVAEGLMEKIRRVDFEEKTVLMLLLNWQPTGAIGAEIDSIVHRSDSLHVYATKYLPPPKAIVTTDIGFPCHVVEVKKMARAVNVGGITERVRE